MFSIWEQRSFQGNCDLIVVGAGITGLFAALHYQRRFPGHRVRVLERGAHPSGASVKNAGFACFGSPSEIVADIDAEGADAAISRVEERWKGLLELRAELGDGPIGFEPTGGHELYAEGDPLYNRVADRFDELNRLLSPVFNGPAYEWRTERKGDLGLRTGHIAFTPLEGPLDSGALMRMLLNKVVASGAEVRFEQHVVAVGTDGDRASVQLKNGHVLTAGQLLVATNGYASELFPGIDVAPGRGQVVLTTPIPGLRLRGTFHLNEGYFYFRDMGSAVLLGGGRHLDKAGETTTEDSVSPMIQNALEGLLRNVILPDQPFSIAHRWSGVMGFRKHGKTPLVSRVSPRITVAAGLSGMGIAIGIRVARQAVDLLVT
jgi:gamma-glutamylputrescine oxidase